MQKALANIGQSLRHVFCDWRYVVIALAAACLAFALSVWLRNIGLLVSIFTSPLFDPTDRLQLLYRLLGGVATADTVLAATMTGIVALLLGVNIALLSYYVVQRRSLPDAKESATTVSGVIAAVFGVGCSACGTLVFSAMLSLVGATGLLALLPLGGGEFLVLSIVLLTTSTYLLAKSIQASTVCIPEELV